MARCSCPERPGVEVRRVLDSVDAATPQVELDTAPVLCTQDGDCLNLRRREALLSSLLSSLAPDRRHVLVAHEVDGLPMAEVAARFRMRVNTGWNLLRLARQDLVVAARRYRAR